jgi:hypothetical protein
MCRPDPGIHGSGPGTFGGGPRFVRPRPEAANLARRQDGSGNNASGYRADAARLSPELLRPPSIWLVRAHRIFREATRIAGLDWSCVSLRFELLIGAPDECKLVFKKKSAGKSSSSVADLRAATLEYFGSGAPACSRLSAWTALSPVIHFQNCVS